MSICAPKMYTWKFSTLLNVRNVKTKKCNINCIKILPQKFRSKVQSESTRKVYTVLTYLIFPSYICMYICVCVILSGSCAVTSGFLMCC